MDHFGIHQRFALALRNESLIGQEAARLGLPCLKATQRGEAPFKNAGKVLDELGRNLGESDTLVWLTAAHALTLLGPESRLLYHDMDVFWKGSPLRLLDHLHEPPGSVHCAINNRAKRGGALCNIGVLAFQERSAAATKARQNAQSKHATLADSLTCAAEKWRKEVIDALSEKRNAAATNGQAMYNRIFRTRMCGFDRIEDDIPQNGSAARKGYPASSPSFAEHPERILVHALPAERCASNQPRWPSGNPDWGDITRDGTLSLHLTSMCFVKGCGAEPNGVKVSVLHALYSKGVWPSSDYFRLADIHRPMVHRMVGPRGQPWNGSLPENMTELLLYRAMQAEKQMEKRRVTAPRASGKGKGMLNNVTALAMAIH